MQKLNIAVDRQQKSNCMMAKSIREHSGYALKMLFNLITSICTNMIILAAARISVKHAGQPSSEEIKFLSCSAGARTWKCP